MSGFLFNEEYMRRLAAGDAEVEKHFTSHFWPLLTVKLRTRLRSPQLVEDVRQETFLRVLQTLRKQNGIHNPEKLGGFVNSVCNNVMLEAFRSSGRLRQLGEEAPEPVDESLSAVQSMVSEERKQLVRNILDELPPKERELLWQVYFEERDKDSICDEMKINPEYLRVLTHRAREKFRRAFMKGHPKTDIQ